jgi:hypothetical protein
VIYEQEGEKITLFALVQVRLLCVLHIYILCDLVTEIISIIKKTRKSNHCVFHGEDDFDEIGKLVRMLLKEHGRS